MLAIVETNGPRVVRVLGRASRGMIERILLHPSDEFSAKEAAAALGVSGTFVRQLVESGQITAVRMSGSIDGEKHIYRIPRASLLLHAAASGAAVTHGDLLAVVAGLVPFLSAQEIEDMEALLAARRRDLAARPQIAEWIAQSRAEQPELDLLPSP